MNIHIRGTVEFEKVLSEPWHSSIETTRARMSVQQLLDTQESPQHLTKQLQHYIEKSDNIISHLAKSWSQPLVQQPSFEWSVNDTIIHTPCWRIETILPRFALAVAYEKQATQMVAENQFKEARQAFKKQEKLHQECAASLEKWTWKLPSLNHDVLQTQWHLAKTDICRGMADLCMLSLGIEKQSASSAMYTVSQRALRHFARSLATWPTKQAEDVMNVSEAMRYYYSSDILWSKGSYGPSIYRLERWHKAGLEHGPFALLKEELQKIPFLAHERRQTNDGAYFDPITKPPALASASELIHTPESTDIPHPEVTPALDVADGVELSPPESSEIQ